MNAKDLILKTINDEKQTSSFRGFIRRVSAGIREDVVLTLDLQSYVTDMIDNYRHPGGNGGDNPYSRIETNSFVAAINSMKQQQSKAHHGIIRSGAFFYLK